ncbi:hypothetical protein HN011_001560 [Eciton burchellii]|nr:hypothetical protein HN011_001560 [Eciton burchellii]
MCLVQERRETTNVRTVHRILYCVQEPFLKRPLGYATNAKRIIRKKSFSRFIYDVALIIAITESSSVEDDCAIPDSETSPPWKRVSRFSIERGTSRDLSVIACILREALQVTTSWRKEILSGILCLKSREVIRRVRTSR